MLSCLLRHGLTRIIVINGHGGNVQAVHEVTQDIYRDGKVLIPSFYLWRVAYSYLPGILGAETATKAAGHGADPLTSVAMHLFPELIRADMVPPPPVAPTVMGSPVINFGTGGVTQFADANGNVQVNQIQQDGFPAGQLQSVGVSANGRIVGNYSNGRNLDLAEISIATFNGTNFLKRVNGGAFEVTDESGGALFGKSGTIVGSSLEGSNTDIADEFTKLIVTQQAYSANTKVITTSNTMVQDLLNVLR